MSDQIGSIILSAGKGSRLKMDVPKPLAPIANDTLLDYVLKSLEGMGAVSLITGHKREEVEEYVEKNWPDLKAKYYYQKEQLGTGHAVRTFFEQASDEELPDFLMVLCADTPLLTPKILNELKDKVAEGYDAVVATFTEDTPKGYGRIVRYDKGFEIVEEKDASDEQKTIKEVNSGLYIFKTSYLRKHVFELSSDNRAGEFYLTDTFKKDANVHALEFKAKNNFLGVNNLVQLALADKLLRERNMEELMLERGVRVIDPTNSYIYSSKVGESTIIYPGVYIDSKSTIGKNVTIEHGCIIKDSQVDDNVHLKAYTYLTDATVRSKAKVGPMTQLRPGADIGEESKVGNFVEIKKTKLENNVSVSHLSYLGDAEVGQGTNIGCGFVTCNYDGAQKHLTKIGENAFVGSDCQAVAPVNIGNNAYVASGSTINKNVPDGGFAIARQRQVTKEDMAKRFLKTKKKQ